MALSGPKAKGCIADINVTPMADVMIVLLIIFMVTLPIINDGPVRRLPEAAHGRAQARGPIIISIDANFTLFLAGLRIAPGRDMSEGLRAALEGSPERLIHIRADAGLPYAEVAKILDVCRAARAREIAFITSPRPRG